MLDIAEDRLFEMKHGVATRGIHELHTLEIDSPNRDRGVLYGPVRAGHLRRVFRSLPIDPSEWALVDLGSGKGRVLLAADAYGFDRAIGVEFAQDLCRVALSNQLSYERRHKRSSGIEIRCADVTTMADLPARTVFYAYNPFDEEILAQVATRISGQLADDGQERWFCYTNPRFPHVIDQIIGATAHSEIVWGSETSLVWRLQPVAADAAQTLRRAPL